MIFPKRHIENIFEATNEEVLALIDMAKKLLHKIQTEDQSVVDYNIGINCGVAAGQSTKHLHIHLITRRKGGVENPIGGVRSVMQGKQL